MGYLIFIWLLPLNNELAYQRDVTWRYGCGKQRHPLPTL
jgi:hypothetical protein